MTLFKKYYKLANNDITPKRELIDKIFETAEGENDKKKAGEAIGAGIMLFLLLFRNFL